MTIEFQLNVLQFICHDRLEGKNYLKFLDSSVFDLVEHQLVFDMLVKYVETYNVVPRNRGNLLEYFDKESKKNKQPIEDAVYKHIAATIRTLYDDFDADVEIIKESIVEFAQYKLTKIMFQDYAPKIKEGIAVYQQVHKKMGEIIKLSDPDNLDEERNRGGFVLKGHTKTTFKPKLAHPTFLNSLNKMTAAGGFMKPQLIIIMGGPKSFKTGTLIKILMEYVRDGLKVYYADCENGIDSIKNRFKQSMMECTFKELVSGEHDHITESLITKFQAMGGDMVVDYYPAYTKTITDVDANLEYLREVHNWVPDIIAYDYLDLFEPSDKYIKDKRLKIQAVYMEAIALNNKWDTFAMSLSQVNKNAVNKEVINMKDFAEDFGKAMNCHAAFALCRTEDEVKAGTARIIPVAQREGVSQQRAEACVIRIDEARGFIEEEDYRKAALRLRRKIDLLDPPVFI